jgi:hypothetical protein
MGEAASCTRRSDSAGTLAASFFVPKRNRTDAAASCPARPPRTVQAAARDPVATSAGIGGELPPRAPKVYWPPGSPTRERSTRPFVTRDCSLSSSRLCRAARAPPSRSPLCSLPLLWSLRLSLVCINPLARRAECSTIPQRKRPSVARRKAALRRQTSASTLPWKGGKLRS